MRAIVNPNTRPEVGAGGGGGRGGRRRRGAGLARALGGVGGRFRRGG